MPRTEIAWPNCFKEAARSAADRRATDGDTRSMRRHELSELLSNHRDALERLGVSSLLVFG